MTCFFEKMFHWNRLFVFQQPISCADLHPERNIIVLGSETSKLLVYDTLSSYYITTITLKMSTGVKSVRFSPGLSERMKICFYIDLIFCRWKSFSCWITKWKCLCIWRIRKWRISSSTRWNSSSKIEFISYT